MTSPCRNIRHLKPVTGHTSRVTHRAEIRLITAVLFVTGVLASTGCAGPGYFMQATAGHWKLMRQRQDVAEIMADPEADPDLVGRLERVMLILGFAEQELGLPPGDNYASYVSTGRDAVVWNVVATPEFSLTPKKWCFPVAGCVPYRGYFEEAKARKAADRLTGKGMDVALTPAAAYSTLGWFRDPVLDTMLSGSDTQLASILIHELAHRRLYLKGQTEFSESYARFVERAGVEKWLASHGSGNELAGWQARTRAAAGFNRMLLSARRELGSLYAAGLPDSELRTAKVRVLDELRQVYRETRDRDWAGRDYFRDFMSRDLNNAHLALLRSYEGGVCAFAALYEKANGNFFEFHRLAAERAALDRDAVKAWLARPCAAIAPASDL